MVQSYVPMQHSLIEVLPKQLLNDNQLGNIGDHFPHRFVARGPNPRIYIDMNDKYTRKLSLLRR